MRKRRISNMSLSPQMIRLADSYFKKKCVTINNNFKKQFFSLRQELLWTRDRSKIFMVDHTYVEWAEEKVKARIETYIDAYKRESLIPTDGDINEIKWDLEDIILSTNESGSVDTQKVLEREKIRIIDAAENDLNIFIQEMELEKKLPKPQSQSSNNQINIYGDNYGQFQQDGQGNTQSSSAPDILLERKEKRLQLMEAELTKLSEDYEKNATLITQKEEQIKALEGEIDKLKKQINVCPFCGAGLQIRGYLEPGAPLLGIVEEYYCGYKFLDDSYNGESEKLRLCPSDPEYPSLDEFDILLQQSIIKSDEWYCSITPKTEKARHVKPLIDVPGRTKEEAIENLKKRYYSKYPFLIQPLNREKEDEAE